jgi:flagellar biosynthetic protein FliP
MAQPRNAVQPTIPFKRDSNSGTALASSGSGMLPVLAPMAELAKVAPPSTVDDIGRLQPVPASTLSVLRAAVQIGFVIVLPFLFVDPVASSAPMTLGMIMVPQAPVLLPLKTLVVVLIDGQSLVVCAPLGTYS